MAAMAATACAATADARLFSEPRVMRHGCLMLLRASAGRASQRWARSCCRCDSWILRQRAIVTTMVVLTRPVRAFLMARPAAFRTRLSALSLASSLTRVCMYAGCRGCNVSEKITPHHGTAGRTKFSCAACSSCCVACARALLSTRERQHRSPCPPETRRTGRQGI